VATIYDVARAARVSLATVSAVLNDTAFVSDGLKTRVETAIAELGYQPNLLARGLAKQRTQTFGMIVPDIANPFFPEVVRGAEDAARAAGYTLLIASSDNDLKQEEVYLRLFLAKRVDGVILTKAPGRMPKDLAKAFASARVPIVLLARRVPGFSADVVEMDDRAAAYEAVSHLLRLGYRRIGMISGLEGASTTTRRREGYRAALRDSRMPLDRSIIVPGDFRVDAGNRAGLAILKQRPDAVFVANYLMSVGFIQALAQYRLRCPEDVAIVTCDDHPWIDAFTPRLTTIDLPKRELGDAAARALIERLAHPSRRRVTIRLPSALKVRDSCGCGLRGLASRRSPSRR
jgi:LacI family transcriptional regulator, galactose operon repressor